MLGDQTSTPGVGNIYFDAHGLMDAPNNTFISRSGLTSAIDASAAAIGRHMESQGFWDDEKELLSAIEKGVCFRDTVNSQLALARRWKNAEKFMLIMTELTEAVEADRKGITESDHLPGFSMLEEEMADIIVHVLDFCHHRGLRIGEAFVAKLDYNASRPHRHGKQF